MRQVSKEVAFCLARGWRTPESGDDRGWKKGGARSRCRVSLADFEGTKHAIDVDAEGPYEAAAIAVAQFKDDVLRQSEPGPMKEFTVAFVPESSRAYDPSSTRSENGPSQRPRKLPLEL